MSYVTRWQRQEVPLWPTFGRLNNLRQELDRLFDIPLAGFPNTPQWTPALDIYEDKENVVIKAELPGMKREEINVSLQDGTLSISGERKAESKHEEADSYRAERYFGRFQRSVTLPAPVAADKVKAQYKDGILTLTLPKTEEAKPKQIEVNFS